jgi:Protein of unknown function (DUF2630)
MIPYSVISTGSFRKRSASTQNKVSRTEDRNRLEKIKIEPDQYWDLLRQRRALREFGGDPNQVKVRPPDVVEDHEQ